MELEADGEFPWVPPAPRPDQAAALGLDGDGELDVDTEECPMRALAADRPRVQRPARAPGGRGRRQVASVTGRFGAEPGTSGGQAASMSGRDGAQPETAEHPPGPRTVDESFEWPLQYARRMETAASGDHWAEVRAKFTRGLCLTICYSGVGQFEAAASWIEKALGATGAPIEGRTQWLQSSDLANRCQRVLLAHGGPAALSPAGPCGPCVFGDLLDRRSMDHAAAWAEGQRAAAQRADAAVEAGRGLGGRFSVSAGHVLAPSAPGGHCLFVVCRSVCAPSSRNMRVHAWSLSPCPPAQRPSREASHGGRPKGKQVRR